MDEESSVPELQEQLREKAMQLLRREREISAMRAKHEQVTRWLKLAQSLPNVLIDRKHSSDEMYALLRKAILSVLRLQRVVLFEMRGSIMLPLAPAGPERHLAAEVIELFQARTTGFCNEPTEPHVAALAREAGLHRFIWACIRPTGKAPVVLVAGFDRDKATFQATFDEGDSAYIENAAQHIETLLGNVSLVTELERERDHLKRANEALEVRDRALLAATEDLRAANENLEQRVRERTDALAHRNRDMRLVLDNVGQALLTIDAQGRLAQERSAVVDRWFGAYEGQPFFSEYIRRTDSAFADMFTLSYEAIAEDLLPREVALHQLPRRLRGERRELQCTYFPLLEGDALTGLLIVVDDVTEVTARDRHGAEQRELVSLFHDFTQDRGGFLAFVEDAQGIVDKLAAPDVDNLERRNLLHTLKGTAALMGAAVVAGICHQAEEALANEDDDELNVTLRQLHTRWGDIMESMSVVIKAHGHGTIEISFEELDALAQDVRQGASPESIVDQLAHWKLEPIDRPLSRLAQHAQALGRRLGKGTIAVTVEPCALRVDSRRFGNLWSALVHVIRNAVDHGLETPPERIACGKPSEGSITFRASADHGNLVIEIADDGRGIDEELVCKLATERGWPHRTPEDLLQALLQPGFSTRQEITETSGRGVGMSAVQQQVKELGGTIALVNHPGRGVCWSFSFARSNTLSSYVTAPPSNSTVITVAPPRAPSAPPHRTQREV